MPLKTLLGLAAILLAFAAFFPYIRAIHANSAKPHVFSWVIWSLTTLIVFFAQVDQGGGSGAWPTGVSSLLTLYVALLAFQHKGDIHITRVDWLFFSLALGSLPFWYLTSDPLWTVVILTVVDLLGFGPTLRKAYANPFDENTTFFSIIVLRDLAALAALEHYSLTTVLFPAAIASSCLVLVVMVQIRRHTIGR